MQNTYLQNVIGQDAVKKEMSLWLSAYKETKYLPHMLLEAEKGNGKSHLAREIAIELGKPFLTVSSADIKNVDLLISVLGDYQGQEVTFFFDECHGIKNSRVIDALLVILEPTMSRKTSFSTADMTANFDFTKQTFLFATTETQELFEPFKDRMERFQLKSYTVEELGLIVQINLKARGLAAEESTLLDIAKHTRGNARAAYKIAEKLVAYMTVKKGNFVTGEIWRGIKNQLGLNLLGLNHHEMTALNALSEKELSLGHLASILGLPAQAVRQDLEPHLLRHNLIEIDGKRFITQQGREYIRNLLTTIKTESIVNHLKK